MRSAIALAGCVLALGLVNRTIVARERHLREGRTVLLALAPVDPRSLMQGDFMALRFQIGEDIRRMMPEGGGDGHVIVALDDRSVARFARLDTGGPLAPDELRLRYRVRGGHVRFATNAFFFPEGDAPLYAAARYGEFRAAEDGELLLTALRGGSLERLGPPDPAG